MAFHYFSFFTALAGIFGIMLNRSWKSNHLYHVPDLREAAVWLSLFASLFCWLSKTTLLGCLVSHVLQTIVSNTLSVFCLFVISYVRVNLVSICPSWPEMLVCFWPFKCLMLILGFLSSKYCLDGEHYLFSEL